MSPFRVGFCAGPYGTGVQSHPIRRIFFLHDPFSCALQAVAFRRPVPFVAGREFPWSWRLRGGLSFAESTHLLRVQMPLQSPPGWLPSPAGMPKHHPSGRPFWSGDHDPDWACASVSPGSLQVPPDGTSLVRCRIGRLGLPIGSLRVVGCDCSIAGSPSRLPLPFLLPRRGFVQGGLSRFAEAIQAFGAPVPATP